MRVTLNGMIAATAGGLLATALLPPAVALADDYDFAPDTASFVPSQVEGFPPLVNEVTGTERWSLLDLTTQHLKFTDILDGTDTQTTIGSFTNDDFLAGSGFVDFGTSDNFIAPAGTQIDLANFGGGFENEWISIPAGIDSGTADLLITPFGDFSLFGTAFTDLAAIAG